MTWLPSTGLLLLAAILLPAMAAIGSVVARGVAGARPGRSLPIAAVAASLGLTLLAIWQSRSASGSQSFGVGRWLSVSGGPDTAIEFLLHWDGLAQVWMLVITAAALLLFLIPAPRPDDVAPPPTTWLLLVLSMSQLAVLSGSFLQFCVAWELGLIAAWRLAASAARNADEHAAARRMLLTGVAGDLPLLVALMTMWRTYRSFEFAVILAPQPESGQTQAAFTLIALGVTAAVLIRCAQFPLIGWFLDAARVPGAATALTMGVLPCGSYLLLRCLPLIAQAPAAAALLTGFGVLSLLTAGLLAVASRDLSGALTAFVIGAYGLLLCGISRSDAAQLDLLLLSATLCIAVTVVIAAGNQDASSIRVAAPSLIVLAILAGGFLGQEAVLARLWMAAPVAHAHAEEPLDEAAAQPTVAGSSPITPVAALAGQLLLGLGLFRAWLIGRREVRETSPPTAILLIALVAPVVIAALPLLSRVNGAQPFPVVEFARLLNPGLTGLITVVALLLAWVLYAQPSPWPSRIEQACGGITRAVRQRFYLDELERLVIRFPVAAAGMVAGAIQSISEENLEQRDRLADSAAPAASPAQHDSYPVVALWLTAACILFVLLW